MNSMYMSIIETTYEQKVEMYMKLDKEKLVEMIIECNRIIDSMSTQVVITPPKDEFNMHQHWREESVKREFDLRSDYEGTIRHFQD